jgi:aminopeptidase YwaD
MDTNLVGKDLLLKPGKFHCQLLRAALFLLFAVSVAAQTKNAAAPAVCATCIHDNLAYLAGPELHGRGSGTVDEFHAAQFIASQLKAYGLAPAAGSGSYIQTATIKSRMVKAAPVLTFDAGDPSKGQHIVWTHSKEFAVFRLTEPDVSAPLQKLDLNDANVSAGSVKAGAAVLLKLKLGASIKEMMSIAGAYLASKAALVIVEEPSDGQARFQRMSQGLPQMGKRIDDSPAGPDAILATSEATQQLWAQPDGTLIKLHTDVTPWQTSQTWNVLAKIEGSTHRDQVILLSAHLDHLGIKDGKTYPGADDDGSGTVAVMELARALAKEPRPARTLVFALWGSEEAGLLGSRYFLKHPTFGLAGIVANLEFEMIGRADPKVNPDQLWLTGWERTDLGPTLAAHGALLTGDPHPDQNFFTRSDNFALAKEGIIAQTVSSYGLHKDYHQPTDTVENVEWQHLDSAIGSMIGPVTWLANSDFTPKWSGGQKP